MKKRKNRDEEKDYGKRVAATKLRRLADCLEQGRPFQIQIKGERIYVPADARFSIEHEREGGEEEIEFQLRWVRG